MNPPTTSAEAAASARHARAELPALRATVARLKAALAARTRRVTALELALVRPIRVDGDPKRLAGAAAFEPPTAQNRPIRHG